MTTVAIQLVPTSRDERDGVRDAERGPAPAVGDQHRADEVDDRCGGGSGRLGEAAEGDRCRPAGGRGETRPTACVSLSAP